MIEVQQFQLPLSAAGLRRPMLDNGGARAVLDLEEWQLAALVDQGSIRGVLDIARPGVSCRELRYAVIALAEYRAGLCVERDAAELARLLFGTWQPLVRARWIYRALNCKSSTFYSLAEAGVIPLARGSRPRRGTGGSAVVEWRTLVDFVAKRRLS